MGFKPGTPFIQTVALLLGENHAILYTYKTNIKQLAGMKK